MDVLEFRSNGWILINIDAARENAIELINEPSVLRAMDNRMANRLAAFYVRCGR